MRVVMNIIFVCFFLMSGCILINAKTHECQITTANKSRSEIYFVEIKSGDNKSSFGYLGPEGAGKTSAGCQLFLSSVIVNWEENDAQQSIELDLSGYSGKMDKIFGFWFYFKGNKEWQVIARSGRADDSPVIDPVM